MNIVMTKAHASLLAILLAACSPDPGANHAAELDTIADAGVAQGFPAFIISRSMPGEAPIIAAAGLADIERGQSLEKNHGFHIASVTKAVTAVAVLKLVDQGLVGLDETLPDYLPGSLVDAIPFSARITVKQLLTHRSGLYSPNNDAAYWAPLIGPEADQPDYWSSEEIVAFADGERNEPLFAPGNDQAYGDINYVLLSLIVEAVTGTPYKAFVAEELFRPLGMNHSYFLSDLEKQQTPPFPRVKAYTVISEIITEAFAFSDSFPRVAGGLAETSEGQERSDGAAGIMSTASDLDRFFRALFDGELLSDRSTAFLLEVASRAGDNEEALGVLRAYKTPHGTIVTAEGDGPGTNAIVAYRPADGALVVALTNLFGRFDESDYILNTPVPAALQITPD
jgi:D-alanyl-D-alanine carboxypeptidase